MSISTSSETFELPQYEYKPLVGPNASRLLRLLPASPEYIDIDAEIITAENGPENANNLKYEAVSWCWGSEPADQVLRIRENGGVRAFHVSRNLKAGLRALRKHDSVRLLWIDAICINQKNLRERNEQVPKMDRIYGKASGVCVWLGEGSEDSKLAINFIKSNVLQLWEFDELIENRAMARHWAALITLMKMPW
jgi:hypothetical protein